MIDEASRGAASGQTAGRRLFWGLFALTLALLAFSNIVVVPRMTALANGGPMLDMLMTGYGAETVRGLLAGMSPDLPGYYHSFARPVDTVFPIVLTVMMAFGLWRAAPGARWLVALPLIYGAADLTENALISRLFDAGLAGFDPGLAGLASTASLVKWIFVAASLVALVATGIMAGRRRRA